MAIALEASAGPGDKAGSERLFAAIALDLLEKGYSINPCALPPGLADDLLLQLHTMSAQQL